VRLCFSGSFYKTSAISGTKGSAGLGSDKRLLNDKRTFEMVNAGLHADFKISKQILPFELILQ